MMPHLRKGSINTSHCPLPHHELVFFSVLLLSQRQILTASSLGRLMPHDLSTRVRGSPRLTRGPRKLSFQAASNQAAPSFWNEASALGIRTPCLSLLLRSVSHHLAAEPPSVSLLTLPSCHHWNAAAQAARRGEGRVSKPLGREGGRQVGVRGRAQRGSQLLLKRWCLQGSVRTKHCSIAYRAITLITCISQTAV